MLRPRDLTSHIVIHCALTFPDQECDARVIRRWHQRNGWFDIGYHIVIPRDGTVEWGRNLQVPGAHTRGHNETSVGIVLAGGLEPLTPELERINKDKVYKDSKGKPVGILMANYTAEQWLSLQFTVEWLKKLYPDALVVGHNDLTRDKRFCPGFSASEWWMTTREQLSA